MVRESVMRCVSLVGVSLLALALLGSCSTLNVSTPAANAQRVCSAEDRSTACPPPVLREFRAVWVATVANIDWPTKPGLSVEQQKAEVVALLNRVQSLDMNAVLLQVRPATDAIYPSTFEPWAEWLTGIQGRSPGYDPLAFWIAEAKLRNIEVHAWFNPYRSRHTKAVSPISSDHISNRLSNAVKLHGGFLWLDPGDRAAQDHSFNVIMDVLRRYDIDGVNFDDYFYPYPVTEQAPTQQAAGQNAIANALNAPASPGPTTVTRTPEREVEFPDELSWNAYLASGGKLARADWRRDNVNRFVERVYRNVKAEKPWVVFGISPFGIGRPNLRPPGIAGFSQYDKFYADVELWLQRGWMDYVAPQLYWPITQTSQAFPELLDYWHAQNSLKRDVFPGLYTSRIDGTPRTWQPKEIADQIALIRAKPNVPQGHIHFSAAPLLKDNLGVNSVLGQIYGSLAINTENQYYQGSSTVNESVEISVDSNKNATYLSVNLSCSFSNVTQRSGVTSDRYRGYALYLRYGDRWQFSMLPAAENAGRVTSEMSVPRATPDGALNAVAASLIDRYSRESNRFVREVNR